MLLCSSSLIGIFVSGTIMYVSVLYTSMCVGVI